MQWLQLIKNIGISSILLLVLVSFTSSPGNAIVGMEGDTTIYTDKSFQFSIIGLNESQWYVAGFTNHSISLENETFLSSGFRYKFDRIIPASNTDIIYLSIYQSNSTGINTSSILYLRQFHLVTSEDLNNVDFIIQNLEFAIPLVLIAIVSFIFVKEANKRRTK